MRPWGLCSLGHPGVEEEIIELGLAELLEGLLSKGLDIGQVRKLQGDHRQAVRSRVILQIVVSSLGGLGVAGAQDESIRFGLGEKLLYQLETLRFRMGQ